MVVNVDGDFLADRRRWERYPIKNEISISRVWALKQLRFCLVLFAFVAFWSPLLKSGVAGAADEKGVVGAIRERGHLICGVPPHLPGFSTSDANGNWSGLNVDYCAALAVAVLGSKQAVKYRPMADAQFQRALTTGDVDVVAGGVGWTMSRDTDLGVRYVATLFYDGEVFLVPRALAVSSALELSGSTVCVLDGTSSRDNVANYFKTREMKFKILAKPRWDGVVRAYEAGECTVLAGELSLLGRERARLADPDAHQILPELISKEPRGVAIRRGDENWFSVVRWTWMALLAAEELGINKANVERNWDSGGVAARRLLGLESDLGRSVGLEKDWVVKMIQQVGNYAEIFDRNLGPPSELKLARGLNDLWTNGGLMYAVPVR